MRPGHVRTGRSGRSLAARAVAAWALSLFLLVDCSSSPEHPAGPRDTTPPEAIADLAAGGATCTTISISWSAPHEDGGSGGAVSSYDIRYGIGDIASVEWDSLESVADAPPPHSPGSRESYLLRGLQEGTTYSVAIRAVDDARLASGISNVASAHTGMGDCIPPGAVHDLAVADTTATSAVLVWTAPAEDDSSGGAVSSYDLRYSTGAIDEESFGLADTVSGEPIPHAPGTAEMCTVTGLRPETAYSFAVRSFDDSGNESAISNVAAVRTPAHRDTIPPDPVNNLAVGEINSYRLRLTWTATGDDGQIGRATAYDVRMRIADHFYETDWDSAEEVPGAPQPGEPGSTEHLDVGGLAPGVSFAFALRVMDRAGHVSAMSNPVVALVPWPTEPLFIDPRGICSDPWTGFLMVAEHVEGGGTLCSLDSLGVKGTIVPLHAVTGVRRSFRGGWFAIGGNEGADDGTIWRYERIQAKPIEFRAGLRYPTALAVRADSGQVIVVEEGLRSVVLYGQDIRRELVTVTDGDPVGAAVDDDGSVYFGVNRDTGGAVIRRSTTSGDPAIDFHDLGAGAKVGDLLLDETGRDLWCLDAAHGAIVALPLDGSDPDTIVTGLRSPNGISPLADSRFVAYSTSDGNVLRALRRR